MIQDFVKRQDTVRLERMQLFRETYGLALQFHLEEGEAADDAHVSAVTQADAAVEAFDARFNR